MKTSDDKEESVFMIVPGNVRWSVRVWVVAAIVAVILGLTIPGGWWNLIP